MKRLWKEGDFGLDETFALYHKLVVWVDRNRDGVSALDEVEPASKYLSTHSFFGSQSARR